MSKTVLISTGEASGDLYASLLAKEIRRIDPGTRVIGIGGKRMREAGVEVFAPFVSALGLTETLSSLSAIGNNFNLAKEKLKTEKPDLVVLIDYSGFNLKFAKEAKALGIKVLYYVSPHVWVWRKDRIFKIKALVDKIALILPFEKELYDNAGVPCEFVGHPIYEEMQAFTKDKAEAKRLIGIDETKDWVALLPGSRDKELQMLLPVLYDTAKALRAKHPEKGILLSIAPNIDRTKYETPIDAFEELGVIVTDTSAALIYTAAEAAVVASGTAAFQPVFRLTPVVVIYKVAWLSYFIGRIVLDVEFINLINIIKGEKVVTELIQHEASVGNIIRELEMVMDNGPQRQRVVGAMREVAGEFEGMSPSRRTAQIALELAGAGV